MKYQRWYDQIIERAKTRTLDEYKERHHILPRALGGGDEPDNLVDLTYREHFLVHWLLTKTLEGRPKMLMVFALQAMTLQLGPRVVTGWQIEVCKRAFKRQALARLARRKEAEQARRRAERDRRLARAEQLKTEPIRLDISKAANREKLSAAAGDWLRADPRKVMQLMRQPLPGKPRKRRATKRDRERVRREKTEVEREMVIK